MPLSKAQGIKLATWLESKVHNKNCPCCEGNRWTACDIFSGNSHGEDGTPDGDASIPMVQLICDNCGYVMLFAAVKVGLLK